MCFAAAATLAAHRVVPTTRMCPAARPVALASSRTRQRDAQGREYIRLDGFLKAHGVASTGGQAKLMVQSGEVHVNGEVETRRGKKLLEGDTVSIPGEAVSINVEFE